jgi:hypothetical protein
MSWSGLHPKLFCRGRFEGFAKPPVIKCHLIRVTVTRLPNGRAVPGPLWLWWSGPGTQDLDLIWRAYLHRFDLSTRTGSPSTPWAGTRPPSATRPGVAVDLAHPRRDHPAAPGPATGRRPPAALGTPPQTGKTQPRPGPPRFWSPGRTSGYTGQPAKTLKGRPRPAQRPHQHARHQAPHHQKSRLTLRRQVKTQAGATSPTTIYSPTGTSTARSPNADTTWG